MDIGYLGISTKVIDELNKEDYNFINISTTPRRIYDVVIYNKELSAEESTFYNMFKIPVVIGSTVNDLELKLILAKESIKPKSNRLLKYSRIIDEHMFIIEKIELVESEEIGHSLRVAMYAKLLGEKMHLSEGAVLDIYVGALLHDIGKIYIPKELLSKKAPLSKSEYEVVKKHSVYGYELLKYALPENITEMIKYHHIRENNLSYPDNNSISLGAKIIAIVDTYDTLVTKRVYNKTLTKNEAIKKLIDESTYNGKDKIRFDPYLVDLFVNIIK